MVYQAKVLFLSLLLIGSWRLVVKNSNFVDWFELPSWLQGMGLPKKLPQWLKQPLHYYVILYFMLGVLLFNSLHDTVKIMRKTDFMDASRLFHFEPTPPPPPPQKKKKKGRNTSREREQAERALGVQVWAFHLPDSVPEEERSFPRWLFSVSAYTPLAPLLFFSGTFWGLLRPARGIFGGFRTLDLFTTPWREAESLTKLQLKARTLCPC